MLEIRLLGQFSLKRDGLPAPLTSRSAQSLLAYLVLHPSIPHRREKLAGLLWPSATEARARSNLRQALHRIRRALGTAGDRCVQADDLAVSFDRAADCWLDAAVLERKLSAPTADELVGVVGVYGGELLPGFYDEWVVLERERLLAVFEQRMLQLLDRLAETQRWSEVIDWGERWIAMGQVPEPAYRACMLAHAGLGDRASAASVYRRCLEALRRELGVEPSEQTRTLYERLARGEVTAGSVANAAGLPGEWPAPRAAAVIRSSALVQVARGPLVGRERELDQARELWGQAAAGAAGGPVLLVSGEPGIGKTRLVRELAAEASQSGALVLTGDCYAEGGPPYAPISQLLQDVVDLRPLASALPPFVLADLLTLMPALRQDFPDVPSNPVLDPQTTQQRLFESVAALCAELARAAPVLLAVDDAHWSDGGTLALLRDLARRSRRSGLRMLTVLTYREGELAGAPALGAVLADLDRERLAARLKLSRLTREQTRDLLSELFQEPITPELLDSIYRVTDGNPFFVEEVSQALIESGQVTREGGGWRGPSLSVVRVPQSVRVAIEARVGRLPEPAQETLRLAALLGQRFDYDTLRAAGDLDDERSADALERAERAQLIGEVERARGGTFVFAHALIPTTLAEGLSGLRRRRMHRRLAEAIERLRADDYEALGHHYAGAGDDGRAGAYYRQAGDRAKNACANEEAARLYSLALGLTPDDDAGRFDLLAARAGVYSVLARRDVQLADIDAMLSLATRPGDDSRLCDALLALADYHLLGDHGRAEEPAQRAAGIARRLGDPVREGHALRRVGFSYWIRWDDLRAREVLEAAAARFRAANRPAELAQCLHTLAQAVIYAGQAATAEQLSREVVELNRQADDARGVASGLRLLGIARHAQHQHSEALSHVDAALATHRAMGDRSEEAYGLLVRGRILPWVGQMAESERSLRQALELAEVSGYGGQRLTTPIHWLLVWHFRGRGDYQAALAFVAEQLGQALQRRDEYAVGSLFGEQARLYYEIGQYAQALQAAETALPYVDRHLGPVVRAEILSAIGRAQAELDEHRLAQQTLETALQQAEQSGVARFVAEPLLSLAYVAWLGHHRATPAASQSDLRQALEWLSRARSVLVTPDPLQLRTVVEAHQTAARLHLALGDVDRAVDESSEAVRGLDRLPDASLSERCWLLHSRCLRAAGRLAEADDHLRRAYERVMACADKLTEEALRRSWLENVWENREVVREWLTL